MKNLRSAAFAAVLAVLSTASVSAAVTVLTFEGVGNLNAVGNFYNGGGGGNLGISFGADALGLVDSDAGGSGNTGGEPSPETVLFFLTGTAATMNVAAGFDTGFSFFYSAPFFTGSVTVYDGLNSTGNVLATIFLPLTVNGGAPDPTGQYSPLVPVGVAFNGIARSVDFSGNPNFIVFDDITLGSQTPGGRAPDAGSSVALLGVALVGMAAIRRKLS
jgi:hypothetical protein